METGSSAANAWDDSELVAALSAHRLRLGERTALFCARRQQLYELNETADAIWLALLAQGTPAAAAKALARGDDYPQLLDVVRETSAEWMRQGQFVPAEVVELARRPDAELHLELDELRVRLQVCGKADAEAIGKVFGQFRSAPDAGAPSISAIGAHGLVFLFEDQQPLGAFDERRWIPELKALITERYSRAVRESFLAHGALLSLDGRAVLLCGDPGAGKTTLTVALTDAGFRYHADDIVRIDEAGRATGVPFSPALKSGSWPLLSGLVAGLDELPVYLRSDGQEVRYLPVAASAREVLPLAAILLLARSSDAKAVIEPVEPLEALTTILASAFSARGAIEAPTLKALAGAVDAARTGRLSYSRLDEAVSAIEAFLA